LPFDMFTCYPINCNKEVKRHILTRPTTLVCYINIRFIISLYI